MWTGTSIVQQQDIIQFKRLVPVEGKEGTKYEPAVHTFPAIYVEGATVMGVYGKGFLALAGKPNRDDLHNHGGRGPVFEIASYCTNLISERGEDSLRKEGLCCARMGRLTLPCQWCDGRLSAISLDPPTYDCFAVDLGDEKKAEQNICSHFQNYNHHFKSRDPERIETLARETDLLCAKLMPTILEVLPREFSMGNSIQFFEHSRTVAKRLAEISGSYVTSR